MNSQLRNKLLDYEVPPPEDVWGKIAASLDEHISPAVVDRLHQYEEIPPPSVWKNIGTALDNVKGHKGRVIPFFVRYRKQLKYSGAAAALIFLAVLTSLLIAKPTESELTTQQGISDDNSVKRDTPKIISEPKEENSVAKKIEKASSEPLIAKTKTPGGRRQEALNAYIYAESFLPAQAERNEMVGSGITTDKYMIYSDGDGNAIRLPKKIFSAFACPTDNFDCKERLQKLREKFAASATTADFNGLLEILKSLQENQ